MSRNQTGGTELIPMPRPTEAAQLSLPIILYSAMLSSINLLWFFLSLSLLNLLLLVVLTARKEPAVKVHCVNHELGFPGHCYCALQFKTSLEYLVHYIAMIEYLCMDLKLSVAFL